MSAVTLIGIDLGKHSFHLHAQDDLGRVVFRKKLSRQQLLANALQRTGLSCRDGSLCSGSHWLARRLHRETCRPRLRFTADTSPAIRSWQQERLWRCPGGLRGRQPTKHAFREPSQQSQRQSRRPTAYANGRCTRTVSDQPNPWVLAGVWPQFAQRRGNNRRLPAVLAEHEEFVPSLDGAH